MKTANLRFKQGSSDKVYNVWIEPQGSGFNVKFTFGRFGSTLQAGTKTPAPVPLQKAEQIFDKLVAEKTGKGYTPAAGGTPYVGTTNEERVTGILPQLLNSINEDQLSILFGDNRFMMQEKKDGRRRLVKKIGNTIIGINRKGLEVALPEIIVHEMQKLEADCVLDGEEVGNTLFVFDALECDGEDIRPKGAEDRYYIARGLALLLKSEYVRPVEAAFREKNKREVFDELRLAKAEGVVFKNRQAPYTVGRPSSGGTQLKYKFYETCTCQVKSLNGDKRSVFLKVASQNIGKVTIPANFPIPPVGALVEVRYLYCFPNGGSLYQPVYLGVRDDLHGPDDYDSLKFKQTASDEDDEA